MTGHITGPLRDIPQQQPGVWQFHWLAKPRGAAGSTGLWPSGTPTPKGRWNAPHQRSTLWDKRIQVCGLESQNFLLVGGFFQQRHSAVPGSAGKVCCSTPTVKQACKGPWRRGFLLPLTHQYRQSWDFSHGDLARVHL